MTMLPGPASLFPVKHRFMDMDSVQIQLLDRFFSKCESVDGR